MLKAGLCLLLCLIAGTAWGDWSNPILLYQNPAGLLGHEYGAVVVDSTEHAHIVYSHIFRHPTEFPTLLRVGWRYLQYDDHGNVLVPEMFISDSLDDNGGLPEIRLFGNDSLWVMWIASRSNDPGGGTWLKYTSLDLEGHVLTPPQPFAQNHRIGGHLSYCFEVRSDRSVIVADVNNAFVDTIFVTVQHPDGTRPLNEVPVWVTWPCVDVAGAIDPTDSLELIWRQCPSWSAIYGKRVSTEIPPDLSSLDDHVEHTEQAYFGPIDMDYVSDTTFVINYWGTLPNGRWMMYADIIARDSYELIAHQFLGGWNYVAGFALEGDSIFVTLTNDTALAHRDVYYRRFRLPDLELIGNELIVESVPDTACGPLALTVSPGGARHVIYYRLSSGNDTGAYRYYYRYWRSDLSVESPRIAPVNEEFTVWPNPTNGNIWISGPWGDLTAITLYDILGRHVQTLEWQKGVEQESALVSMESLPSGSYYLHFATVKGTSIAPLRIAR